MSDEVFPLWVADWFARAGDPDAALRWVGQAITWGFANSRFHSEHDRFLVPLRGDPRCEALLALAREKPRVMVAALAGAVENGPMRAVNGEGD